MTIHWPLVRSLLRGGLRMSLTLESDFEVIGETQDGDTALTLASTLHPDVIVMDIEMPGWMWRW